MSLKDHIGEPCYAPDYFRGNVLLLSVRGDEQTAYIGKDGDSAIEVPAERVLLKGKLDDDEQQEYLILRRRTLGTTSKADRERYNELDYRASI